MAKPYLSPVYFSTYKDFIPDFDQFMQVQASLAPVFVKRNSLKCSEAEFNQFLDRHLKDGAFESVKKVNWVEDCFEINAPRAIVGGLWEHHIGLYYMLGASSFIPVKALDPKPNEVILDMCAAPGGKSFLIAEKMNDTGVLIANEPSNARRRILKSSLDRMGVTNTQCTNFYGEKIPDIGLFDKILLDGPCSGEGSLRGTWSRAFDYNRNDEYRNTLQRSQRKLLDRSTDLLKPGGRLVYSTCTYDPEENEMQVDGFLKRHSSMSLIEMNIDGPWEDGIHQFKETTFNPTIKLTKRIYPHRFNSWGFFFATFVKQ
ncbi:MAG: hypothetical protein COW01_13595 [Bdellovibrionales bacterium CG12_big_fil_rev_8_21_14_0_65_38_15]|nr:MAG: hypothetical protein COW79_16415 [Bdellovibrionales bacterium CG22_combo_CG10-13_8_21_14_all_38_13]PIQ53307.1 MAG: hypothetical protein COW01_13595 [Bdellovibrionales bacterium CG12_big_fil_rev_8_21_14_0_65_38_15]PIR30331.1 MAG: hypothetical protein COV38_06165 [Bdellovibrionales bacterium CG11_big_fil_rev_8_21_14_0_20_38_13]